MKSLAVKLLRTVEHIYLYSHGWRSVGDDLYKPPEGFKHPTYHRCHAVNAQRQVYARGQ